MSATPDNTLANPVQRIADLQRHLVECRAELDKARRSLNATMTERDEALAREAASAELLQIINSSPGDLTPVFVAILDKAHSLCGAEHGSMVLREGKLWRAVATRNYNDAFAERLRQGFDGTDNPAIRPLIEGARYVQIPDLAETDHPVSRAAAELAGLRTGLFIPLRRNDLLLGHISASRPEVRVFSEKQIEILENFAAQAVIAMENARLLTETREALEQQTATAEVLQVINSSPGDLAPVFDAILEKAHRLCGASHGSLTLYDGERFRAVAAYGHSEAWAERLREGLPAADNPGTDPLLAGARFVHFPDTAEIEHPLARAAVEATGVRTALFVPLRKDGALLGVISANRREVRPFSDKEIALLQNFAAQAEIAMENARLLTETREALEQQTATAEVLQVINSSPGDLTPVFDAILEKAHTLCDAAHGDLTLADGENFCAVAMRGLPQAFADVLRRPFPRRDFHERLLDGVVHVADLTAPEFSSDSPVYRAAIGPGGVRTLLAVPLRRDGRLLGYITANRQKVRPFADKQIALLQNFAAQAVIAMENARLLTETRKALEQQTATAEVLQVINSSPDDLGPVFEALLGKAVRLCEGTHGHLWRYDGEHFHPAMAYGEPQFVQWFQQRGPIPPQSDSDGFLGRMARGERILYIADVRETEAYRAGDSTVRALVELSGGRSVITVALRKENELVGAITVYRQEAVHRQANLPTAELCRAGRNRDGKCSSLDRDARGTGATDRDCRGVAGHQFVPRQPHTSVRRNIGEGAHPLRGSARRPDDLRRRIFPRCRFARNAAALRRLAESAVSTS
jgi:GAF domain-containing protein